MTPIEDDYVNGMTSNKEYRVRILLHSHHENPSCTAVDGSNASNCINSRLAIANHCKGVFLVGVAGVS